MVETKTRRRRRWRRHLKARRWADSQQVTVRLIMQVPFTSLPPSLLSSLPLFASFPSFLSLSVPLTVLKWLYFSYLSLTPVLSFLISFSSSSRTQTTLIVFTSFPPSLPSSCFSSWQHYLGPFILSPFTASRFVVAGASACFTPTLSLLRPCFMSVQSATCGWNWFSGSCNDRLRNFIIKDAELMCGKLTTVLTNLVEESLVGWSTFANT